jgi:hypothetical protein
MIRFNNSNELVNALVLLMDKHREKGKKQEEHVLNNMDTTFKLGKIDANYTSGRPRIIFEGETDPSIKAYPYLSSYTPVAGDVVLLARVDNTYVILGKRM